jgi:hypothetical protein
VRGATIRRTVWGANASLRACAWPGYRRGDVADGSKAVSLKARYFRLHQRTAVYARAT